MPDLLRVVQLERPSEPRERLLAAASAIFYAEGIRHVGVERIIGRAGITKATFYRHFPSKEDLVLAYLAGVHALIVANTDRIEQASHGPADALRAISASIAAEIKASTFRGCAFINAAAEYPAPTTTIHLAVLEHRAWFFGVIHRLLVAADDSDADRAARHFVMLRDGAMVTGYLGDRDLAGETLTRGIQGILLRPHDGEAAVIATRPPP